jgi:hypothetical protein
MANTASGPEQPPREMPGTPKLPGAYAGHENVKDEGSRLDDCRRKTEERHDGDVAGSSGMTDTRVEKRHDENGDDEKGELFSRHS